MKSLKKATGWIIAGVAALLIIVATTSATTIVSGWSCRRCRNHGQRQQSCTG